MSLSNPLVFVSEHENSADFTISVDDEDHKFSVVENGDLAILSYEKTLSYRGTFRVKEPRNEVFKPLMQSSEMTEYLESNDLESVRRERNE